MTTAFKYLALNLILKNLKIWKLSHLFKLINASVAFFNNYNMLIAILLHMI